MYTENCASLFGLFHWTICLLFIFSIAERKDVGKSKSLRKSASSVEERLSNAGLLCTNGGNPFRKMIKIVTFLFASVGHQKEQTKQQQIFSADTENSLDGKGTSKSVGE